MSAITQIVVSQPQASTIGLRSRSFVEENEFWLRLEYRIGQEFAGFDDRSLWFLRKYWVDGLEPGDYDLLSEQPCIRGRAWTGRTGQEDWEFVLYVDPTARSREEIDWAALLPDDRLTGWLTPDTDNKIMIMNPLDGYPD